MLFQEAVVKYGPEIIPFTQRCNSDEGADDKPFLVQLSRDNEQSLQRTEASGRRGHFHRLLFHWEDVIQPTAKIPSEWSE
jgi:hypothetical protein